MIERTAFIIDAATISGIRRYKKTPGRVVRAKKATDEAKLGSSGPSCDRNGGPDQRCFDLLHDLGARRRSGDVAGLDHKALLERTVDSRLDIGSLFAHDLGYFRDDERLGAIEHPLLTERETL